MFIRYKRIRFGASASGDIIAGLGLQLTQDAVQGVGGGDAAVRGAPHRVPGWQQ